jgi:hypothetical protein
MTPARFPHSDTPGSTLGCQLPRAYRRLLRPSSALDAKASTMCPSQLVTHTTNPTPEKQSLWNETRDAHPSTTLDGHDSHKKTRTPTPQSTGRHAKTTITPTTTDKTSSRHTGAKDARVHYPDLKQQPHTGTTTPHRMPPPGRACSLVPKPQTPAHTLVDADTSDSSEPQQCVVDVPQLNSTTHRPVPAQHSCWTSTRPGCTCSLERR